MQIMVSIDFQNVDNAANKSDKYFYASIVSFIEYK